MEKLTLFEELRLIERCESDVNGVWKGAHLLLFFLAFVFGSFCTFCFHMLMYLFDEKCVLFPKLLSLTSLRHNIIYEFIPEEKERADMLPVDFLSTQWIEKSACYLPTYVPLISGIFGLVWTTMFLMCSTGSTTGLQRPWRVIPPVFVFSLAMGGLCIYSSTVTHFGLQELCVKLGEITGSPTCSYTVNVATLVYERKIRGVYQATRLTITSAWLHTACWLASAVLALVRILLAVDFTLVRVRVEMVGDMDRMLERHEEQLRTISPNTWEDDKKSTQIFFENEHYASSSTSRDNTADVNMLFVTDWSTPSSEMAIVPQELFKLARLRACSSVPIEHQFIVNILYDILEDIEYNDRVFTGSSSELKHGQLTRQYGHQDLAEVKGSLSNIDASSSQYLLDNIELENHIEQMKKVLLRIDHSKPGTSKGEKVSFNTGIRINSEMDIDPNSTIPVEMQIKKQADTKKNTTDIIASNIKKSTESQLAPKSNLKSPRSAHEQIVKGTEKETKNKVKISEPNSQTEESAGIIQSASKSDDKDNKTERKPKEKQD